MVLLCAEGDNLSLRDVVGTLGGVKQMLKWQSKKNFQGTFLMKYIPAPQKGLMMIRIQFFMLMGTVVQTEKTFFFAGKPNQITYSKTFRLQDSNTCWEKIKYF